MAAIHPMLNEVVSCTVTNSNNVTVNCNKNGNEDIENFNNNIKNIKGPNNNKKL